MARVIRGSRSYSVKAPDWLLHHAGEVVAISIADGGHGTAVLTARLADGGIYLCDVADASVAVDWVRRPAFRGLALTIIDAAGEATRTVC